MPIEINDAATAIASNGQPVTNDATATASAETETTTTETPATETPEQTQTSTEVTATAPKTDDAAAAAPVAADVNISSEALRQITALSKNNREAKKRIAELETQAKAAPDVTAKLTRLEQLEAALTSPRKWLALANKTLEDVAADTLQSEHEVNDPRVDTLATQNAEMRKEIEALKKRDEEKETQQRTTQVNANVERAREYVKSIATSTKMPDGSLRWERITKDANFANAAVDASIAVVDRDYGEKKDADGKVVRAGKPVTREIADKILAACLDEAEAMALARELIEARQKGTRQPTSIEARSKGIEIRGEAATAETPTERAKPTIDDSRSATRTAPIQRGQTDVRTARARALKIAGAD